MHPTDDMQTRTHDTTSTIARRRRGAAARRRSGSAQATRATPDPAEGPGPEGSGPEESGPEEPGPAGASTQEPPAGGGEADASASRRLRSVVFGVDVVALAVGWILTALAVGAVAAAPLLTADLGLRGVAVVVLGIFALSASGLHERRIAAVRSLEMARCGRVGLLLGVLAGALVVHLGLEAAATAVAVGAVAWSALLVVARGLIGEWIHSRRAGGHFTAPVVVIGGDGDSTVDTVRFLDEHPVLGFEVRGVLCPATTDVDALTVPWLGELDDDTADRIADAGASGVVVDAADLAPDRLNSVVHGAIDRDLHVHVASGLRGITRARVTVAPLADETVLHVAPSELGRWQTAAKRVLDLVGGTLALVLLSPLLAVAALAVWAQDRGPVLFRQERVGKDGSTFTLLKLRTMVLDADEQRGDLERENERAGPLFKVAGDPRVTRVGRFLRAASIDEIPQLFNVLAGDMSLVGPRPALPREVAQFDDALTRRQAVKPGVTGLWQVEARDLPSFELYRRYDLLYVQNWSVGLDLAILARTVAVVGLRGLRMLVPRRSGNGDPLLD